MTYPPPSHYPPQYEPPSVDREKAGLFQAGKVAIWVWVVLTLIPILLVLACCGFCGFSTAMAPFLPTPSTSATP